MRVPGVMPDPDGEAFLSECGRGARGTRQGSGRKKKKKEKGKKSK